MQNKKILIVEDESVTAEDLSSKLSKMGYEITGRVASADGALASIKGNRPDLVLMDILINGDRNGIEAARLIQDERSIPVVYITALSDEKTLADARATDPYGFIIKPYTPSDLRSSIELALYKYDIESRLKKSEEKYRILVDGAVSAIFIVQDEVFKYANPATEFYTGYGSSELVGKSFRDIVHPDFREIINYNYGKLLNRTGQTMRFGFRIVDKNGKGLWIDFNGTSIEYEGRPAILGEAIDITEKKLAEETNERSLERLRKIINGIVNAISYTVETRDPYTAGHQKRVAELARMIAVEMDLPPDTAEGVYMAGIVHDIGKITVPSEILTKPGSLSETEMSLIRIHSQVGHDILKGIEFPWPLAQIVLQHHERLDGSGYPHGLRGDEILMEARIISVSDVVEAMASHRPYRAAIGSETALEEIEKNRGVLYYEPAVDACLSLFRDKGFSF